MRERSRQQASRLRRFLRKPALGFAICVGLYLMAGIVFRLLIWAETVRIRHEGDPVSIAQLAAYMPADSRNGAILYEKAFKLKRRIGPFNALWTLSFKRDEECTEQVWSQARAETPRFARVARMLDKGSRMPECRFRANWDQGYFPRNPDVSNLNTLLHAYARTLAHDGKPNEAIEALALSVALADSLKDDAIFFTLLNRSGVYARSADAALDIAARTQLDELSARKLFEVLAWRKLGEQIPATLKWERVTGAHWYDRPTMYGLINERPGDYNILGEPSNFLDRFVCSLPGRPILWADKYLFLLKMRAAIRDSGIPFRKRPKLTPNPNPCECQRPRWPLYWDRMASIHPVRESLDGCEARINGARTALALCVYRQRFGAYPQSLSHLRRLGWRIDATDPFTGRDFVYKRLAKGFVLYSFGSDLKDDHGQPERDIVWSSGV